MIYDFRNSAGVLESEFDVCIVGSGPAGTSLALELSATNLSICIIESGDTEPDGDTQSLYEGEVSGFDHTDLDACRLRYLGGSSNCWNGWCMPFDAHDFERKPWVAYSGWPISYKELEPYYRRAGIICEIGDAAFDDEIPNNGDFDLPEFDRDKTRICYWRSSPPTRFGERYRTVMETSPNLTVLLNANAVEINTEKDGAVVTGISVVSLDGARGVVRARQYVLACGGIENPRLLLASRKHYVKGVGNWNDQVGRYFMEHPYAISALVYSRPTDMRLEREKFINGVSHTTVFCIGQSLQEKEQVLGSMLLYKKEHDFEKLFSWGRRELPPIPDGYVRDTLISQSEQVPDPDSRITLSDKRDRLGYPQARMEWKLNEVDKRSISVQVKALGAEFARLGLGRLKLADWLLDEGAYWGIGAGNHHMGTTRMGDNPKTSVVDKHCGVHELANLHIAGSSVFATSSWVNPTLTIVALAIRLADRLKKQLQ